MRYGSVRNDVEAKACHERESIYLVQVEKPPALAGDRGNDLGAGDNVITYSPLSGFPVVRKVTKLPPALEFMSVI